MAHMHYSLHINKIYNSEPIFFFAMQCSGIRTNGKCWPIKVYMQQSFELVLNHNLYKIR